MIHPPWWAETLLHVLLTPEDAETISGDLIEQYRDSVYPARGRFRANVWLAGQAVGFAGRVTWVWAALFTALMVGRNALDWLLPPDDFYVRSAVTTYSAIGILVACGTVAGFRTRSLLVSVARGMAVIILSAPFKMAAALALLAIWHDPQTMTAIARSGGVGEVFELPLLIFIPAAVFALAGGVIGKTAARVFS